jgi:hypothetical protein
MGTRQRSPAPVQCDASFVPAASCYGAASAAAAGLSRKPRQQLHHRAGLPFTDHGACPPIRDGEPVGRAQSLRHDTSPGGMSAPGGPVGRWPIQTADNRRLSYSAAGTWGFGPAFPRLAPQQRGPWSARPSGIKPAAVIHGWWGRVTPGKAAGAPKGLENEPWKSWRRRPGYLLLTGPWQCWGRLKMAEADPLAQIGFRFFLAGDPDRPSASPAPPFQGRPLGTGVMVNKQSKKRLNLPARRRLPPS